MMSKKCNICNGEIAYKTIGMAIKSKRVLIGYWGPGKGKLSIIFEEEINGINRSCGIYQPKYCPECGRKLDE